MTHGFDVVDSPSTGTPFSGVDPADFVHPDTSPEYLEFLRASIRSCQPVGSLLNGAYQLTGVEPGQPTAESHAIVNQFLNWERSGDWAAFLNLMNTHSPYCPVDRFNEWGSRDIEQLQAETTNKSMHSPVGNDHNGNSRPRNNCTTARFGRSAVQRIVETLKQRGVYDDTLIVFTGPTGKVLRGEPPQKRVTSHAAFILGTRGTAARPADSQDAQADGQSLRVQPCLADAVELVVDRVRIKSTQMVQECSC